MHTYSFDKIDRDLKDNLWEFGLNPKDWIVERVKTIFSKKEGVTGQYKLTHWRDQELSFEAEARLQKGVKEIQAEWSSIELLGI